MDIMKRIVFQMPRASYNDKGDGIQASRLEFIPKSNGKQESAIPILYIQNDMSKKIMLYFHGNAEDIGLIQHTVGLVLMASYVL